MKLLYVFIILGMHRSGTSLVASILHNCGISMGYDFLREDKLNSNGYYEDLNFLGINKSILENCNGTWAVPPTVLCIKKNSSKFERIFKRTIADRIQKAGNKSWGWKDPRNSLTCWYFHDLIPNSKYIIVQRNREDVISSLKRSRSSMEIDWSKLYDRYYESIRVFMKRNNPSRTEVFYDDLINRKKYARSLRNLLNFVGVGDGLVRKASSFINFR